MKWRLWSLNLWKKFKKFEFCVSVCLCRFVCDFVCVCVSDRFTYMYLSVCVSSKLLAGLCLFEFYEFEFYEFKFDRLVFIVFA